MKYLIPIVSIGISSLLVSCGNSSTPLETKTVVQTTENTAEIVTDTTSSTLTIDDPTLGEAAPQTDSTVETTTSSQPRQSSVKEDAENEKFRLAELERRRQLALLADPTLNIPDPKQVIADEKEKATFTKVVEKQTDLVSTKAPQAAQKPKAKPSKPTSTSTKPVTKPVTKPSPKPEATKQVAKADPAPMTKPTKQAPIAAAPVTTKNTGQSSGVAKINFTQKTFAFDTIVEGDVIDYQFKFVNTGTRTVEILNAKASCGCTRPSFPFLPIEPGQEGYIGVKYDSRTKSGDQTPEIEVVTNFQDEPIMLYLNGYVKEKAKDEESGK